MNYCVIIPARYQSSRLPGKPLIDLCGLPMIVRTYQQCIKACPSERVFVATDDERIRETCELNGIQVIMTTSNCLTGTDRIAECAQYLDADTFINVQGDEPLFNPNDLKTLIEAANKYPQEVLNGYCEIKEEALFRSSSIPKVVFRPDGRLLYMSRAAIPSNKKFGFETAWRQVCAYAFPRNALSDFSRTNQKTQLENIEDIEILRFLELGWEVRMLELSSDSVAVDTLEDIQSAETAILERGL
ncbi:3-deoxy-manno-octulosonate cytidylyltransferase (CMP-KDO synthetase) [Neobacillus niacini]|uniref:3-deoxy-manno-octulosonate cytidylyltransferase n=1 Tax=Neobacillus niacini TaxID=86668 RepID=UPI002862EEB0|nr:3-deoxy-manno-octulosonate cytidylyltransferase [Neobacillus niacini]MDR7079572.1 3-deoxy-manno-octulosonate cytidylyltransferase (CMP-KDO synthetase) [Neobacillus niacini]